MPHARTVLCISSYFKGNRFLQRARRDGHRVFLLTVESLRGEAWAREAIDDFFVMPSLGDLSEVVRGVAWLLRRHRIDRVATLDDYDVELGAALREQFRLPGLGMTPIRFFRDKLAMRMKARELGVPVPAFVPLWNHDDIRRFLAEVPPPWLVKPRHEASSIGIKKFHDAESVWRRIEELGDEASYHLLERFVPSDLFHVDSIVADGRVAFAEVGRYHRPLLEVYTGGGVFATRTLRRDAAENAPLRAMNERVLMGFGLDRGASHTEFLRSQEDGAFYFLETSCRVGGAGIADMVEAATGLNPWEEWAAAELAEAGTYSPPAMRSEYGGAVASLAREEQPDDSAFRDPEVFRRLRQKHHISLILRSADSARIDELLGDYMARIVRDHQAILPPADKATS